MAIPAAAIAKAAIGVLSNEKTRKAAGWVLVAILSPIILLIAAFCSILGGSADHNSSILDLCFYGGTLPADIPAEYRAYIEDMQASFALLDERIAEINSMTEDGESLDAIRVKAFFYALYFGAESPSSRAHQQFVDCFVTYEERTRPLDSTDSEDESAVEPEEETYTVAIPITDIATIWSNIQTALGETVTEEQRNNADSIYNLVRYGSATGTEGWIPGAEVPFIGADGFCSPVGSSWESRVTSEFGYRSDPFTGQTKGHTGIDIAVPTGTPVRAALPGVVTNALGSVKGKKQYGYLPKKLKELVDAITDELALQPDVAACYQVWNDLRDKLEGYYKDKPRVHNPLSKQKEFKAIKNSIIREADRLRLELEQEEMDSTNPNANEESGEIDSTMTPPKTDSAQQPIKSPAVNNHNPAVIAAVTRLLYHMGQIFRDNAMAPTSPLGLRIDSKRRKKLMAKRLALGHKADDHEEQGWQNGPSM